jgi:hypothetical protein
MAVIHFSVAVNNQFALKGCLSVWRVAHTIILYPTTMNDDKFFATGGTHIHGANGDESTSLQANKLILF